MSPILNAKAKAELLAAVPIGEKNAMSARAIWRKIDVWAEVTVNHSLRDLAAAGTIHTNEIPPGGGNTVRMYWRDA